MVKDREKPGLAHVEYKREGGVSDENQFRGRQTDVMKLAIAVSGRK